MTSMPASRSERAITFAPRSWPSRPAFAITTRMGRSMAGSVSSPVRTEAGAHANEGVTSSSLCWKELHMRFIPARVHAPLDYIVGAALIAAPWIFQFSEHTSATIVPFVLRIGLIAYSLFTNYELGVWKVAPMAVHNLIDIAAGGLLAASPWIFGFADGTANVWVPHLVVGLAAVFLGLTTKQAGGHSYRKPAATAAR